MKRGPQAHLEKMNRFADFFLFFNSGFTKLFFLLKTYDVTHANTEQLVAKILLNIREADFSMCKAIGLKAEKAVAAVLLRSLLFSHTEEEENLFRGRRGFAAGRIGTPPGRHTDLEGKVSKSLRTTSL